MLVWNDLAADEKLRIYDRGVNITSQEGVYDLLVHYRSGDMWAPQVEQGEALRRELVLFRGLHFQRPGPVQRRMLGAAGRQDAGGSQRIVAEERIPGLSMNSLIASRATSNWGKMYSSRSSSICTDARLGDETKIGAFVEIQKNASVGKRLQDIQSQLHL